MITKKGTVVSIPGKQTIKVEVNEYRAHPKYKKRYRITRRFLAHDEKEVAKLGEEVTITPIPPVSKRKSWKVSDTKAKTAQ